ncbi:4-hydroxy-2-oxo-heptane-1,7-dioate aldolase [Methylobacterium crusticola]|uniref:4-hydroxy-2-oxo-heptane-1,7-dioate aldolase n=1 Tax=Methylobacterium crusticola TaxID=1697972 RepID=A0ABQ4QWX5_9HYPH|nr:aldolase/citrate lyase family protein [Methylobacterium crusticola]GJD49146.1 4-hydroxy-2-oxo-heptane-1,7-dioate aldolase [Methylobacterium crusticola]
MTAFENPFKQGLADRRRQAGLWLTTGAAGVTEIAAGAGFAWLLLDMEHSPNDLIEVVDHLRAAVGGTAEPVVRVPWNEPVVVKRLLDQGARSLMFPFVQSAEEARRAVAATRYPPQGIRGFAGTSRATGYGLRPDYAARAAEEICVVVQVETPEAIRAAGEIAAVPGIDGVFIGPNDLAANMGHLGRPDAPPVRALIAEALAAIGAAGKAAGLLNFSESGARADFEAGFSFVAVSGDAFILARETQRIARTVFGDAAGR